MIFYCACAACQQRRHSRLPDRHAYETKREIAANNCFCCNINQAAHADRHQRSGWIWQQAAMICICNYRKSVAASTKTGSGQHGAQGQPAAQFGWIRQGIGRTGRRQIKQQWLADHARQLLAADACRGAAIEGNGTQGRQLAHSAGRSLGLRSRMAASRLPGRRACATTSHSPIPCCCSAASRLG